MEPLSSGDLKEVDRLANLVIPALVTASIGIPALYAALAVGNGSGSFLGEWLVALLIAGVGAGIVNSQYGLLGRSLLTWVLGVIFVGSWFVAAASAATRMHAFVFFIIASLGLSLSYGIAEECAVAALSGPRTRKRFVWRRRPLSLELIDEDYRPSAFTGSRGSLIVLIILATLLFAATDILQQSSTSGAPNPVFFAVPFYLLAAVLLSMTSLVRQVSTLGRSVQVAPGFVRGWMGSLLAVLGICGLLALLLPKSPVIGSSSSSSNIGQYLDRALQSATGQDTTPPSAPPLLTPNTHQPRTGARSSSPRKPNASPVALPGLNTHGLAPSQGTPLTRGIPGPIDSALRLVERTATAFEKSPPAESQSGDAGGKHGQSTQPQPTPNPGAGNGQPTTPALLPHPPTAPTAHATTPPTGPGSTPPPGATPPTGPGSTPHAGMTPSTGPGSKPPTGTTSPAGTGSKPQSGTPGSPSQHNPPGQQTPPVATPAPASPPTSSTAAPTTSPAPAQPSTYEQIMERLRALGRLLMERPVRILKLLLALLLVLGVLALLTAAFRRFLWSMLRGVAMSCWRWLGAGIAGFIQPLGARMAGTRREQEIQHLLHTLPDPFALAPLSVPPNERVCRAYATFMAYLWLIGQERRPAETAFDFATRLCESPYINSKAVWTLTRSAARAQFAGADFSDTEATGAQEALAQLAAYVVKRVPEADLPGKQDAYRRQFAEEAYAAKQEGQRSPAHAADI